MALVDVPVERGCMTFIPGSHRRQDLRAIDLTDAHDLFNAAPDLAYEPRVTVPLRAGDCTFHNGYLAHTANANDTDEFRYAMVNIYVDAETRYNGAAAPVHRRAGPHRRPGAAGRRVPALPVLTHHAP